jgi:hypothetical protein
MNTGLVVVSFAAALFASGCAYGQHYGDRYTVRVDPAFTATQVESVLDAAAAWEAAVPVALTVVVSACAGVHSDEICIHASTMAGVVPHCLATPGMSVTGCTLTQSDFVGFIDGGETYVAVDAPASRGTLTATITHELGHGMGLLHHPGENLMDATEDSGTVSVPQANDVAQYAALR